MGNCSWQNASWIIKQQGEEMKEGIGRGGKPGERNRPAGLRADVDDDDVCIGEVLSMKKKHFLQKKASFDIQC
jgi:hypothetical protein